MEDDLNIPPRPLLNSKPNPPILGLSTAQVMGFIYSHLLYRDLWCHHLGNHSQYHWLTTIINNWHTVTTAGTDITSVPILAVSEPATNCWHYHWWEDNCHYCCSHNCFWNSSEHTALIKNERNYNRQEWATYLSKRLQRFKLKKIKIFYVWNCQCFSVASANKSHFWLVIIKSKYTHTFFLRIIIC